MAGKGTSEGRFLFEFNGITSVRATEVTGVGVNHEEFELYESNKPNPNLGRGHFNCDTINVRHAHALNQAGAEFYRWMKDFIDGTNVERRGGRLIVLDEDGESLVQVYELINCVPKKMEADSMTAGGKNASFFKFQLRPEEIIII